MAINFPTSLDNLTNNVDNVDTVVAQDINDLNDAVEALEAKVGIDNSAVSTSIDYILKNKIWPVGSIYINAGVSTNPATLLGFGTWVAFGAGKMIIGIDSGDADFDALTDTGGAKAATLTTTELPAHAHTGSSLGNEAAHTHTGPSHQHGVTDGGHTHSSLNGGSVMQYAGSGSTKEGLASGSTITLNATTASATTGVSIDAAGTGNTGAGSSHTHSLTIASAGSGSSFSIMNPYVTAYMWKRTV